MFKNKRVYELTEIGLMSGIFCVLAPIAMPIPFSPVPITFGTLVLYVTAALLGARRGTISVAVYLLIGLAGLPVFSGFTAGFTKLLGPGGGYMIGYLFAAGVIGWLEEKRTQETRNRQRMQSKSNVWQCIPLAGLLLCGAIACYTFGTIWFMVVMDGTYSLGQALMVCVVPFLPFELLKIVMAAVLIPPVKRLLIRAGVL